MLNLCANFGFIIHGSCKHSSRLVVRAALLLYCIAVCTCCCELNDDDDKPGLEYACLNLAACFDQKIFTVINE